VKNRAYPDVGAPEHGRLLADADRFNREGGGQKGAHIVHSLRKGAVGATKPLQGANMTVRAIHLTSDESLVLFEFLQRFCATEQVVIEDQAEEVAL
jgi:hypothetical protein